MTSRIRDEQTDPATFDRLDASPIHLYSMSISGKRLEAFMTATSLDDLELRSDGLDWPAPRQYYYLITNQTAAGGTAEFPVITDATLYDLSVTHWFADGTFRQIPLRDIDGMLVDRLDSHMVYLEGRDAAPLHPLPPEAVTIAGRITPPILEVQKSPLDAVRIIRAAREFSIDVSDPIPGTFIAVTISDREGSRYTVGTFGIGTISE
jgi:hypothetical protein